MNFKYKAYLQKILSVLPKEEKINYFFQRYITKSLPIPDDEFITKLGTVNLHFDNFKKYSPVKNANECTYYEFGSGYDMVIPIAMSLFGFKKLICIDIRKLAFPELINDSINRLRKFRNKLGNETEIRENIPVFEKKNYKDVLMKFLRIEYIAPLDARKTGIENDSIDFILSNATMEHILQNDIGDVLKECYRILKPGGIMSNAIDYRDHWSFFDNSISVYNYLGYNDDQWDKLNPAIMYQNRMRHRDYIELINEKQFEITEEKVDYPDKAEFEKLKKIKLDPFFRERYSDKELSIKSSILVLKKPYLNSLKSYR